VNETSIGELLRGVSVVEVGGPDVAYAGRLLTDLGASVTRVVDAEQEPAARPDMADWFDLFLHDGKAVVRADATEEVEAALAGAQVVLVDGGSPLPPATADVWIDVRAFSRDAGIASWLTDDLLLQACGGLLTMTGEPGSPPLRLFGDQTAFIVGCHAAGAALIALYDARRRQRRVAVEVSKCAAICHTLETAVQFYAMNGVVRERRGAVPMAGDGTFHCRDGIVVLACLTDQEWQVLLSWLADEGLPGVAVMRTWAVDQRRTDLAIEAFTALFERWAAALSGQELIDRATRRGVLLSPASTVADIVRDDQLRFERWFAPRRADSGDVLLWPGPPYRVGLRPDGPGGARRTATGDRPLSGVRVLEFTFGGAAPLATKPLADFGADVVKVEFAGRPDFPRQLPPYAGFRPGVDNSGYFANRNSSKRSIDLNLKDDADRRRALALAAQADVVLNNFRSGVLSRLGLRYADVAAVNPDVIWIEMPFTSAAGPKAGMRGFGRNVSALTGLHRLTGYSPDRVVGPGTHFPDHSANPGHGLVVLMAALIARGRTVPHGCYVEVAQLTSTLQLLGPWLLRYLATGEEPSADGNHHDAAFPYGAYRCGGADTWLALSVRTGKQWRALCGELGADVAAFADLGDVDQRRAVSTDIEAALGVAFAGDRTPQEWARLLQAAGVPAAPVNTARDVIDHPDFRFLHDDGYLVTVDHPTMGPTLYNAPPYRYVGDAEPRLGPAPCLGAHTDEVVADWLG
jgi:crotonobetainyl-CoA:carnitine CoA-transferase CaiB-like acyl-CoA transferase